MQWTEIRRTYPGKWLLVEALAAYSRAGKRIVEDLAVVDTFSAGTAAMRGYQDLHRRESGRELYVVHTDCEALDIGELHWFGIRAATDLRPDANTLPTLLDKFAAELRDAPVLSDEALSRAGIYFDNGNVLDLARSRRVEQEVLDLLDEPSTW